jgi:hypothetical protein
MREKVTHHCELFNLEEKSDRTQYSKRMSEILSDENCKGVIVKEITKKMKIFSPDESIEQDQIWKLIEWDVHPPKAKPYTEKRTAEEDIP